jgi:hypothetical protein
LGLSPRRRRLSPADADDTRQWRGPEEAMVMIGMNRFLAPVDQHQLFDRAVARWGV